MRRPLSTRQAVGLVGLGLLCGSVLVGVALWSLGLMGPEAASPMLASEPALGLRTMVSAPVVRGRGDVVRLVRDAEMEENPLDASQRGAITTGTEEATAACATPPTLQVQGRDEAFAQAFVAYTKLHLAIVRGEPGVARRWVLCKPSAQLGNRLRFTASCLLLAMLTDRALAVSFQDGYYASLRDLFEPTAGIDWEAAAQSKAPVSGRRIDPKDAESLLCSDLRSSADEAVELRGNFHFAFFVARNPAYQDRVRQWFPRLDLLGKMLRVVFRPNAEVRRLVESFKAEAASRRGEAHWRCDIGFQIRNDNDPVRAPQISDKEWELYRRCARDLLPRSKRASAPSVFVATDSEASRQICQREVPWPFEMFGEFHRSNNPDGVRRALVDMLLFAECDIMLVSPWSSYGRMATVYADRASYMVTDWVAPIADPHRVFTTVLLDSDKRSGCFRFIETEECPWFGETRGASGFNDVIRATSCWDAAMILDAC